MRVGDVYFTGLGVMQPKRVSAREAVAKGWYDETAYKENGLTAVCVAGEISPPEMAVIAARHAFARSGEDPKDVGALFHSSAFLQGPEMWLPGYYIQRELIGGRVPAFEIRLGCNGLFGSLELATCRMAVMPHDQTVLVTTADNMESPLLNRWNVQPGFLIGDAGSSVILSRRPGFARLLSVGTSAVSELEQLHRGNEPLFPPGASSGRKIDMTERAIYFRDNVMDLTTLAELGNEALKDLTAQVLDEADTKPDEIARIAYNNTAGYFLEHLVLKPLNYTFAQSTFKFGSGIGHTGASDQLLSLNYLLTTGGVKPGDRVLLSGGAPGYSLACAVVEILEIPDWKD
ncbi:MAG: ketoacyl-ACP synthase III family protein [Actinocatenispora sp.]